MQSVNKENVSDGVRPATPKIKIPELDETGKKLMAAVLASEARAKVDSLDNAVERAQSWLNLLQHARNAGRFYSLSDVLTMHLKVIHKLPQEELRKNSEYVQIWVGLALEQAREDIKESRSTFKYMRNARIGLECSYFYRGWSDVERSSGNLVKALSLLEKGRARRAQPCELLDDQSLTDTFPKNNFSLTQQLSSNATINSHHKKKTTNHENLTSEMKQRNDQDTLSMCTRSPSRSNTSAVNNILPPHTKAVTKHFSAPLASALIAKTTLTSQHQASHTNTATHSAPITSSARNNTEVRETSTVTSSTAELAHAVLAPQKTSLKSALRTSLQTKVNDTRELTNRHKCSWARLSPSPPHKANVSDKWRTNSRVRFAKTHVKSHQSSPATVTNDAAAQSIAPSSTMTNSVNSSSSSSSSSSLFSSQNLSQIKVNGEALIILEVIGKGGSGKVYKVLSPSKQILAVKQIKFNPNDENTLKAIRNEVELLKKLRGNDNIVQLLDAQEDLQNSIVWMVFEFGEIDLANLLSSQKGQPLNLNYVRTYFLQILEAIDTIHKHRIVHSDLKPANFLMVKGKLKLIDFGIALAMNDDTTHAIRESQIGTISYMSPEAILWDDNDVNSSDSQSHKLRRSSDVWSLGCILYVLVTGRTPFHECKSVRKFAAITNPDYQIKFPSSTDEGVNADIVDILKQCLQRDPQKRPTVTQLLSHPLFRESSSSSQAVTMTKSKSQSLLDQRFKTDLPVSAVTNSDLTIHRQVSSGARIDIEPPRFRRHRNAEPGPKRKDSDTL